MSAGKAVRTYRKLKIASYYTWNFSGLCSERKQEVAELLSRLAFKQTE